MKGNRLRLLIALIVFAGWLGFLGYLAMGKPRPVVVSRAQLAAATHAVILKREGKPTDEFQFVHGQQPDVTPQVDRLAEARLPGNKALPTTGEFLLLLEETGIPGHYRLAREVTVYPWNADVQRQVQEYLSR